MADLVHLSESALASLREGIEGNLERYAGDGFAALAGEPGWAIDTDISIDTDLLATLDGSVSTAAADLENSRLVWRAMSDLSPSLANEERIWVRLSHVECFKYSQARWLDGAGDRLERMVELHMFAPGQTAIRDDHAISRLWWNGFIASHCMQEDQDRALELLLTTADVRSNIIERVWLTGRRPLVRGVFRAMEREAWVLSSERSFREFMKSLNKLGAGIIFEAMREQEIDSFLDACMMDARHASGDEA